MALAGTPQPRYTIVPAREVFVSTTTRHQLAGVTTLLAATGRKYGPHTDTIPTGDDALANNVAWNVMLAGGRFKDIRSLTNDPQELYGLRADPEDLDNLAIKPEDGERLAQMRELAVTELREDDAGFVGRMPAVREVGYDALRKYAS